MAESRELKLSPYDHPWADYGCIYFVLARSVNLIKIGFTDHHPDQRLASLQAMSPVQLEPIAVYPGSERAERELHRRFDHLRSHGEWFHLDRDIRLFLRDEAHMWPEPMPSPGEILANKKQEPGEIYSVCEAATYLGITIHRLKMMVYGGEFCNIRCDQSPLTFDFETLQVRRRMLWED